MIITKKEIIEAINTEPLSPGYFCKIRPGGECTVCAVGAVFRKKGMPQQEDRIERYGDAGHTLTKWRCGPDESLSDARASQEWLSVLSIKFEKLCEKAEGEYAFMGGLSPKSLQRVRKELTAYVKRYFPEQIEVPLEKYL